MVKKTNIIWFIVWMLCVYMNGIDDISNPEISLLKRIVDSLIFGSGIFLVIYFAWTRRFHLPQNSKMVSKRIAFLMLASAASLLVFYLLGIIKPLIFFISGAVWSLIAYMLLKPVNDR